MDLLKPAGDAGPAAARAPASVEETGLPFLFLVELISKVLFLRGQVRLPALSAHLKLSVSVLDPLIAFMRSEKLCEVNRLGGSGTDADLNYQLSDGGRTRAAEYLRRNAYSGPAPVTLADYNAQVAAQSVARMHITRADVAAEFGDLVVAPNVLEQLGAAMNSGRAVFLHGPAGSGKTYLAERLSGLLNGAIALPHAIMIEGEVVPFYDPMVHALVAEEPSEDFDRRAPQDRRWVRAARPAVLTGGELTLDMLDLQFDPGARLYQAPPHLKANNGIFIIDDLGRQRCSPVELMNRWIVPMARHVDYLSLHTGYKFPVPFDVIVVFSSNFPPEQLADGSFLRRIGYKIHVGAMTPDQYETIFRRVCAYYAMAFDAEVFAYLLHDLHAAEERPLLACYPRDILAQVSDLARYEGREARLDRTVLAWAWNNYFTGT
ncbi:ATP-binding protein [Janthinobacterium fluminis]|uniref:ATP-binding protein n=1 Tax=Janthinobacterium fluminis TaxID=2987524 RepID=A0ABT5K2N7_9BURK|nr:ATP-binding protein [Janthinobacterium fluminis]MDC8759247.1 ATP-binding protein [Janthinobacterium fluminis]